MVTISEAYFDESYEDRSPRILCVAGYVFRKSRSIEFGKQWSAYLRRKGLPYFHANECAHSAGVFKGRTDNNEIARKLIQLTKEKSDYGVAVAIDRDVYSDVFTDPTVMPTAYAFALMQCVYRIAHWRARHSTTAPTAFFFEQGHKHADDAHRFLNFMLKSDEFAGRIAYRSHAFVPKETSQVQPGDLLAWLWRLDRKRAVSAEQRPTRKDLIALHRPQDDLVFFERRHLEGFRAGIRAESRGLDNVMRQIARDLGLPEDMVEEVAAFRPDYKDPRY